MAGAGHARRLLGKQGYELTEGIVQELDTLYQELESLRQDLEKLRVVSVAAVVAARAEAGNTATVMAGDHLGLEQGFYPAERTESGVTFSWTGPSPQFSFDVTLDRPNGADLRLEAINFIDFDRQNGVRIYVDAQEIPATVSRDDPGVVITAELPPKAGEVKTHVAFLLPEMLSPESAEDTRSLGLAFVRLIVAPR